jgi:polyisoprenyl-phosphate glycosyltransferase
MGTMLDESVKSSETRGKDTDRPHPASIGLVIPLFEEAASILGTLREVDSVLAALPHKCTIIVVDDGSRDNSVDIVLSAALKTPLSLIRLSRNFGKEIAMSAGLSRAEAFDAVIIMDADGQHPPKTIREFVAGWENGFDDVYGVRASRQTEGWLRNQLSGIFYRIVMHDSPAIAAGAGDFRLLSSRVVRALNQLPERQRFMKGLYAWVGFRKMAVPYEVRPRASGNSKFSLRSLVRFAVVGLTSFSNAPLRAITRVGYIVSAAALTYGLYIAVRTLIVGVDLPGWATLTVALSFLSGVQLISIGVLGEYTGQIFLEAKNRPLYLIDEIVEVPPLGDKHD